jgi:hypothetical protein
MYPRIQIQIWIHTMDPHHCLLVCVCGPYFVGTVPFVLYDCQKYTLLKSCCFLGKYRFLSLFFSLPSTFLFISYPLAAMPCFIYFFSSAPTLFHSPFPPLSIALPSLFSLLSSPLPALYSGKNGCNDRQMFGSFSTFKN